jgi:molybdopterin-guanine dinucleotide biosynthesis protein A
VLIITSREQFSLITAAQLRGKVIVDFYPGKGALGGIYTGLVNSNTVYSLVVGCDMPFLNRNLLRYLVSLAPNFDVVVPRTDGMLQPLHAVYSKSCLHPIERLLHEGSLGILQLFNLVKTRYVDKDEIAKFDPEHLSFFNINTQGDLEKAKALMKQRA